MFKMTPDIEQRIRDLSANGKSGRAIALEIGCSITPVMRVLNPESIKRARNKYRQSSHGRKKEQEYRDSTKEQMRVYSRQNYLDNLDRYKERNKRSYQENKPYYAEKSRRSQIGSNATPSWLTPEDFDQMRAIYCEAQRLSKESGILHEVDHVHPLNGQNVCGFHCPSNLQILAKTDNRKKGNKF